MLIPAGLLKKICVTPTSPQPLTQNGPNAATQIPWQQIHCVQQFVLATGRHPAFTQHEMSECRRISWWGEGVAKTVNFADYLMLVAQKPAKCRAILGKLLPLPPTSHIRAAKDCVNPMCSRRRSSGGNEKMQQVSVDGPQDLFDLWVLKDKLAQQVIFGRASLSKSAITKGERRERIKATYDAKRIRRQLPLVAILATDCKDGVRPWSHVEPIVVQRVECPVSALVLARQCLSEAEYSRLQN